MTDDPATLLRGLEADVPDADPRFLDRLHDQLAGELGLTVRRLPTPTAGERPIPIDARRRRIRWSGRTLLVAAVLAGTAAALGVAGTSLVTPPPDDLLTAVRKAGVLRVEVVAGTSLTDFSKEVARRIGERMGVPVAIVDSPDLVGPTADGAWDLSLPGPVAAPDPARYPRSEPLHGWPVWLVAHSATSIADLAGATICAQPDTAGALWVEHPEQVISPTPIVPPPPGARLALATSLQACKAGLGTRWDAMLFSNYTMGLGWDRRFRQGVVTGGRDAAGDPGDNRVLTVPVSLVARRDGPDPASLLALVDEAIRGLRADGSLGALSLEANGFDVTTMTSSSGPGVGLEVSPEPTATVLAPPSPRGDPLTLMVVAPSADRASWGEFSYQLARLVATRLVEHGRAVELRRVESGLPVESFVVKPGRIVLQAPSWAPDGTLRRSVPAYYWPSFVVTAKDAGMEPRIRDLADLAGETLCAESGSLGAQWATGDARLDAVGPVATLPPRVNVTVAPAGDGCLDGYGLEYGTRVSGGLELRSPFTGLWDWTVGGRPGPGGYVADPVFVHPVSFVVADAPGAEELLREIDDALASLRADGTLLELSRSTLDGRDLVTPPEP